MGILKFTIRHILFIIFLTSLAFISCESGFDDESGELGETKLPELPALLASRFETLEDLKNQIEIEYHTKRSKSDSFESGKVVLTYNYGEYTCISTLSSGISQKDIIKVRDGKVGDAINLMVKSPFAIANRVELNRIYKLARRRQVLFGADDVAFFDLALRSVENICTTEGAFMNSRDSSEKGYLNTFNHITAQAFITSIYSKEMADYVADVHERKNMPELIHGNFTKHQLMDSNNNPVDNYVDLLNNELGQTLGSLLKVKYDISYETEWTEQLLADYLNDIQLYYSISFGIGMKPFNSSEHMVIKFAQKINESLFPLSYQDS